MDGESKIAKKITELKKKRREAREKYNDFADDDSNDNEANKDKALKWIKEMWGHAKKDNSPYLISMIKSTICFLKRTDYLKVLMLRNQNFSETTLRIIYLI